VALVLNFLRDIRDTLETRESPNLMARKRGLPHRRWLADKYLPSAHNKSMTNDLEDWLLLTTVNCLLSTGTCFFAPPYHFFDYLQIINCT
jgi:hypothetical protein